MLYGALVFAVFQMFTWLPFSAFVDIVWGERVTSSAGAFVWLMAMAALTALVEEGGRAIGYRYLFPRSDLRLTWRNGVAFGLGHSALETMWLIAGLTFVSFVAYLLAGPLLAGELAADAPGATSAALLAAANVTWTQPLVVALERILALPHQVAWALLVMESLASRQKRWFGFASPLSHLGGRHRARAGPTGRLCCSRERQPCLCRPQRVDHPQAAGAVGAARLAITPALLCGPQTYSASASHWSWGRCRRAPA